MNYTYVLLIVLSILSFTQQQQVSYEEIEQCKYICINQYKNLCDSSCQAEILYPMHEYINNRFCHPFQQRIQENPEIVTGLETEALREYSNCLSEMQENIGSVFPEYDIMTCWQDCFQDRAGDVWQQQTNNRSLQDQDQDQEYEHLYDDDLVEVGQDAGYRERSGDFMDVNELFNCQEKCSQKIDCDNCQGELENIAKQYKYCSQIDELWQNNQASGISNENYFDFKLAKVYETCNQNVLNDIPEENTQTLKLQQCNLLCLEQSFENAYNNY